MQEKHLFYIPLERYKSRYTEYLSGIDGMFYHQVEASGRCQLTVIQPDNILKEIKHGRVVDYVERSKFAFAQMQQLLEYIAEGIITDDSVIYFEDFWTPGFEMLPYALHLAGIRPRVYAFCHAQTFDKYDFTYPMQKWMRPLEIGWMTFLSGVFVASADLASEIIDQLPYMRHKIYATGTVFCRELLYNIWPGYIYDSFTRKATVAFTSRLAPEKNPEFFHQLVDRWHEAETDFRGAVNFAIFSGQKIDEIWASTPKGHPVQLLGELSKADYFYELATTSVVFNCADQDFVSYTLLEALAFGAFPLYTSGRPSFVDTLGANNEFLYEHKNVGDAVNKLDKLLIRAHDTDGHIAGTTPGIWRYGIKYENSVQRMLDVMFANESLVSVIANEKAASL